MYPALNMELREELRNRGLAVSGVKADLIKRLQEDDRRRKKKNILSSFRPNLRSVPEMKVVTTTPSKRTSDQRSIDEHDGHSENSNPNKTV